VFVVRNLRDMARRICMRRDIFRAPSASTQLCDRRVDLLIHGSSPAGDKAQRARDAMDAAASAAIIAPTNDVAPDGEIVWS
jgi:hypothetical protein